MIHDSETKNTREVIPNTTKIKNIIVIYAITIKSANGFNEAKPSWATVAITIKPATPMEQNA